MLGQKLHTVHEKARETVTDITGEAGDKFDSVKDKVASAASGVKDSVGGAFSAAKDNLKRTSDGTEDGTEDGTDKNVTDDDNSINNTLQRVRLYSHEQPTKGIFEVSGVVTAVWLKPSSIGGRLEKSAIESSLRQRVREIVKLNPWLAGWLKLKTKATTSPAYLNWHTLEGHEDDEKALDEMVQRVFQNRIDWEGCEGRDALFAAPETAATSSFSSSTFLNVSAFLRSECPQTKMPLGFGLLSKSNPPPLFKVAWDYDCPNDDDDDQKVLLVMSLAHPIADGTTYFQIFQMLYGETLPYALDATRPWSDDHEDNPPDFTDFRDGQIGKRNASNLDSFARTTQLGGINIAGRMVAGMFRRSSESKMEQIFLKVNGEGVSRVRKQLAAMNGRKISMNDILLSALTQIFQVNGRWNMWKDFRLEFFRSLSESEDHHLEESPELMALKAAGNHIALLSIFAKEYNPSRSESPNSSSLKKSLVNKVKATLSSLISFTSSKSSTESAEVQPGPARIKMQSIIADEPDYDAMNQLNHKSRMANVTNWTGLQKIPRALPKELFKEEQEEATVTNSCSDSNILPGGGAKVLLVLPLPEEPPKANPYIAGNYIIFHPDFSTGTNGVKNNVWISAYVQLSYLLDFVYEQRPFHFIDGEHSEVEVPFEDIFVL